MDFKKFYLSPEGRVNRKQFWLWLVLPLTVMGILLASIDVASGNYNPETGYRAFHRHFRAAHPNPDHHRVYQALP